MARRAPDQCPESLNGQHELSEFEVEVANDDSTVVLITCLHCEVIGRVEIPYRDIEWKLEEEDEDEDEDDDEDEDEDDDPLRRVEEDD